MAAYYLKFELPGVPRLPNGSHGHWRKKWAETTKWKMWTKLAVGANRPHAPLEQARLVLTRCTSVEPDFDNLAASFKAIIDGLREAGVLVNDRRSNIGDPKFRWQKAARNASKVIVEVEEMCN